MVVNVSDAILECSGHTLEQKFNGDEQIVLGNRKKCSYSNPFYKIDYNI